MWYPIKSKFPKSVKGKGGSRMKKVEHISEAEVLEKQLTKLIVKLINSGLEDSKIDPNGEQAVILFREGLKKIKQAKSYLERAELGKE